MVIGAGVDIIVDLVAAVILMMLLQTTCIGIMDRSRVRTTQQPTNQFVFDQHIVFVIAVNGDATMLGM